MGDTRNVISPGASYTIKGKITTIVTSLVTNTNDIQQIINLLNKCPMHKSDKEGDSHTLSNYEKSKSILKAAVKYNRDRIFIYLNINNLNFKPSLKPEIFEDCSENL